MLTDTVLEERQRLCGADVKILTDGRYHRLWRCGQVWRVVLLPTVMFIDASSSRLLVPPV